MPEPPRETALKQLLRATLPSEVEVALDMLELTSQVRWEALGRIQNNRGAVKVSADPGRALIERVTNSIDSVLELEHDAHQGLPFCQSPHQAAQAWLDVPEEGLSRVSSRMRQQLAERIQVRVLPGTGRSGRTVEIRDRGTGMLPGEVADTILSLHGSNKLQKRYLVGVYGQGGSSTFSVSKFSLIATKAASSDVLSLTVVKYQDLPPEEFKTGHYVYLTEFDGIFSIQGAEAEEFASGTLVRHFGYDLSGYDSPLGPGSVYGLLNQVLFDPVMPIWLDYRVRDSGYRRVIKGSRNALNGAVDDGDESSRGPTLDHWSRLSALELPGYGHIGLEYWLLEAERTNRIPIQAFVRETQPIIFTINGQNQGERPRSIVRERARLPYLTPRLIVHVACDDLNAEAKRLLFVSTREGARAGQVRDLIEAEIVRALREDDQLDFFNQLARERSFQEQDEAVRDRIRNEVVRLLGITGRGTETRTRRPYRPRPPRPSPPPIDEHDPPTYVHIVWPHDQQIEFFNGQRRYIRIETDSSPRYYSDDEDLTRFNFIISGGWLERKALSHLRGGRMRILLEASGEIGNLGSLRVELTRTGLPTLSDEVGSVLVSAPLPETPESNVNAPDFEIFRVSGPDDDRWSLCGWSTENPLEFASEIVENPDGKLDIYYSEIFPAFARQISEFERRDQAIANLFRTEYEILIAFHSILMHRDSRLNGEFESSSAQDEAAHGYEEVERQAERRRMAMLAVMVASRQATSS